MSDLNDLLQHKLARLQNNQPDDDSLHGLNADDGELAGLLSLAAAMRALPQPQPSPEVRAKVLRAVETARLDHPRAVSTARPAWNLPRLGLAFGILAVVLVMAAGLALWQTAPVGAQVATVMEISGQVEVTSRDALAWTALKDGDKVEAGQRLRTLDGSQATLVFYEGSRTTLGANAVVQITRLDGGWGKSVRVLLDQAAGKTSHSVVPLRGKNSQFVVNTQTGAASVHGTRFAVDVNQQTGARFAVTDGSVLVYSDQSQVTLKAGQTAAVALDAGIDDPAYQFSLSGELQNIAGNQWTVEGAVFYVDENTAISESFFIGDLVAVEGHILPDSTWLADTIIPAVESQPFASLSGVVEAVGDTLRVSGYDFVLDTETDLPAGLQPGMVVAVTFSILPDGDWLAVAVEILADTPPSNPPESDTLVFQPDELSTSGCGDAFSLTGTLTNTGSQPASASLESVVLRGGSYVESVEISPSSFASLTPGQSAAFTIAVATSPDYRDTTGNQKQIKLRIFVSGQNGQSSSYLNITIVSNCKKDDDQPTPTLTQTPGSQTPTITLTPTVTPTGATPTATLPAAEISCTGNDQHPTGMKLAARYNVSYEEIMGWFCKRNGFGEIDLAYTLSQQSGKPVAEIFALRESGMGWGNIKKMFEPTREPKNDKPEGKPTKKPKKK